MTNLKAASGRCNRLLAMFVKTYTQGRWLNHLFCNYIITNWIYFVNSFWTKSNAEFIGGVSEWDENTPLNDDEVEIPFYTEVALSAGNGHLANEDGRVRSLRFSKDTLKSSGVQQSSAVRLRIKGDSMEPVLPNGTTVGIDTSKTKVVNGKMFAIRHGDEVRIKKLYTMPVGGLRVVSYNADEYPEERYTEQDVKKQGISIIGQVFWYSVLLV